MVSGDSPPNTSSLACSQCAAQGNLSLSVSPIIFMLSQSSAKPQVCCQIDRHRTSARNQPSLSQEPQSARRSSDAGQETERLREEGGSENFDSPLLFEENSDEQSWDHSQRGGGGGGGRGGGGGGGLEGDWRAEEVEMEEMEQEELEKIEQAKKREEEEEEEEKGMERTKREELERMEECERSAEVMLVSGPRQMRSTHHKWMKSILQECSEELLSQGAQLSSLTPPIQSHTPTLYSQVRRRGSLSREDPLLFSTLCSTPREGAWSGASPRLGGASPKCMLRISKETQSLLIRSPLLQPIVLLTRLPPQHRGTRGEEESGSQSEEEEEWEDDSEEEEDGESVSFDVNSLFSDSSDESEPDNSDSDYVP